LNLSATRATFRAPVTPSPALELRNLRFRYADGREALRGIDLRIDPGECVGLLGPNGAGKSTLLLHLNGLLPERPHRRAEDAAVFIGGLPVAQAQLVEIRRRVGLVFQDSDDQLFCPTVGEDVAFGPAQLGVAGAALAERVRVCLTRVGLASDDAFLARSPGALSRGEKRRVCLAGVLACEPSILVLDEPTSDLDPRGRRELQALLRALPSTKLIATHDLELVVALCPRSVLLDAGRVVADGPTVALLSDEPLMLAHGLEKPHILLHHHPHGAQ